MSTDDEIQQQLDRLAIHRRTLGHLLRQAAEYGGAILAPPITANGIISVRQDIHRIKSVLRNWGVSIEDHPDDEEEENLYVDYSRSANKSEPTSLPSRDTWLLAHSYPTPPNFTGRLVERERLTKWLNDDQNNRLLVVRALGGFGKTALAWHWLLNDVVPVRYPQVVWWSFYENANFDVFVHDVLTYFGGKVSNLGPRQHADALLRLMLKPGILIVLDGFERELRAFSGMSAAYQGDEAQAPEEGAQSTGGSERDCISYIAEYFLRTLVSDPRIKAKVLMTTRLRPCVVEARGGRLLQGCHEIELEQMDPGDAVLFFQAEGVSGTDFEIKHACERYGYHPLSMRLLVGLIINDLQQPGDIAVAQLLDISGDLVQRKHHVLEQAYEQLLAERKILLSRIACFRSPVTYDALRALTDVPSQRFDAHIKDLIERGLLQHDRHANRYDLHPIVRRYAYDRLAGDERGITHARLRNYFAAVPVTNEIKSLDDLAPVIELYHHSIRAGRFEESWQLLKDRLDEVVSRQFTAVSLAIDLYSALFPDGERFPPKLMSATDRLLAIRVLGEYYGISERPQRAIPLIEQYSQAFTGRSTRGDVEARGLISLGVIVCLPLGRIRLAEELIQRGSTLARARRDEENIVFGQLCLGLLFTIAGCWKQAEAELNPAQNKLQLVPSNLNLRTLEMYRVRQGLLLARANALETTLDNIITIAQRALGLVQKDHIEYFHVQVLWLMGAIRRIQGDNVSAEQHLVEALVRCRRAGIIGLEADILLDLARFRYTTAEFPEALRLAEEAARITDRCGYVLQGADIHQFLAARALENRNRMKAILHARIARQLATCDGPPNYTYKVTYDEAGALLQRLDEQMS